MDQLERIIDGRGPPPHLACDSFTNFPVGFHCTICIQFVQFVNFFILDMNNFFSQNENFLFKVVFATIVAQKMRNNTSKRNAW